MVTNFYTKQDCKSLLYNDNNKSFIDSITYKRIGNNVVILNNSIDYNNGDFFKKYRQDFKFSQKDSFSLINQLKSKNNNVDIYHYQQYHDGIIVKNSVFIENIVDCFQYTLMGYIDNDININRNDTISTDSLNLVISNNFVESFILNKNLVITKDSLDCESILTYKISLSRERNQFHFLINKPYIDVYINAKSGKILYLDNYTLFSAPGKANLLGIVQLEDTSTGNNNFTLKDSNKKITTENAQEFTKKFPQAQIVDAENWEGPEVFEYTRKGNEEWTIHNFNSPLIGDIHSSSFAAHYNAGIVWDYFNQNFNTRGPGSGKNTSLYIAASWKGNIGSHIQTIGGNNETQKEHMALRLWDDHISIVAHEWTHTIMLRKGFESFANEFEQSSIIEGFCDVFASLIAKTYNIGSINNIRKIDFPPINHINKLSSAGGNPHSGGGILTKVFYLLKEGGNHYGFNISTIGEIKVRDLFWDVMNTKLSGRMKYSDLKDVFITSAIQLFGPCSWEVREVTNAWASVGLGIPFNDDVWVTGNTIICKENLPGVNLILKACNGSGSNNNSDYEWYFPNASGWHVSIYGPNKSHFSIIFTTLDNQFTEKIRIKCKSPSGIWTEIWITLKDCDNRDPDPCNKTGVIRSKKNNILKENTFSVFPNPSSTILSLNTILNLAEYKNMKIFNYNGNLLFHGKAEEKLNVEFLKPGVYQIYIDNGEKYFNTSFIKL